MTNQVKDGECARQERSVTSCELSPRAYAVRGNAGCSYVKGQGREVRQAGADVCTYLPPQQHAAHDGRDARVSVSAAISAKSGHGGGPAGDSKKAALL
jgi:hypothetical protein